MTPQEKIIALAKLDGFGDSEFYVRDFTGDVVHRPRHDNSYLTLPNYLTSYDAIITLVHKMEYLVKIKVFENLTLEMTGIQILDSDRDRVKMLNGILKTPSEMADALLKAIDDTSAMKVEQTK